MSKIPSILWYLGIKSVVNQVFQAKRKSILFLITMSVGILGLLHIVTAFSGSVNVNLLFRNLPSFPTKEVFVLNAVVLFFNLPLMLFSPKNRSNSLFSVADLTLMELNPNRIGEIASSVLILPLRILIMNGTAGVLFFILSRRFSIGQGIIFFIGLLLLVMLLVIWTIIAFCLYSRLSNRTIRYLQFLPFCITGVIIYYLVRGFPILNVPYMPHTVVITMFQAAFTGSTSLSMIIRNLSVGIGYVVCLGFIMFNILKSTNWIDVYQTSISTFSDVYLYSKSLFQNLYKKLGITRLFLDKKKRLLAAKDLCQLWSEKLAFKEITKEVLIITPLLFLTSITAGIEGAVVSVLLLMGYSTYRLSITAIAREKDSLWILRTCGLSSGDIVKAKFGVLYLMMAPISICFVIPFYGLLIFLQRSLLINYWETHLISIIWGLFITLPPSISMGLYFGTKFHYLRLSDKKVKYSVGTYDYTLFSSIYISTIVMPSFLSLIFLTYLNLKQISFLAMLIGIVALMIFACNLMFKRSSNAVETLF